MTLAELQALALSIQVKTEALQKASTDLKKFIDEAVIFVTSPMAPSINVDQFVSLQSPPYGVLLTAVETAADGLGTDPFH